MKKFFILLFVSMLFVLGACDESTDQEKEVSNVEKESDQDEATAEDGESEESEEESYDEVLMDTDKINITLESIVNKTDDMFGDSHVIKVSIENKSDDTLVVQTDKVSVDGMMVTDNVFFSEEVAAGKKANGKIEIQSFEEDEELPPLEEELEMVLKVIDEETYDTVEEEKVNIEIK